MPWVRVDDGLFLHPKWLATPANARGLWVTALSYCGNQANGGIVPAVLLPMLGATVDDADALVKSGLWTRDGDGYRISNFCEYNPTSTPDARAERAEARSRAGRKAGLASATKRQRDVNDGSTIDQRLVNDRSTNVQRDVNDRSTSSQRNSTPIPSPSPIPSPTYTDTFDCDLQRARENDAPAQSQKGPTKRPLTARPPVRSMDNQIDRPQPQRRESEPEARARRAVELSKSLYDAEDDAELERINQWYRDRETKKINTGETQ